MLIAIGRNLLIVLLTIIVVGISVALWPIDDINPERRLSSVGARLAYAYDETLLVGAMLEGPGFGDDEVEIASKIPSLQRLSLTESNVTRRGIRSLRSLPKLISLNLTRTRWTFEAVDDLCQLQGLRELTLEGCEWLHDDHIAKLATLPNLELLNLSSTSFTLASLEHLKRSTSLKVLILHECTQIDDNAIDSLIGLAQQRPIQLCLSWTEITATGLSRLRAALPQSIVDLRPSTIVGLRDISERGQFTTDARGEINGFRRRIEPDGFIPDLHPGDLMLVSSLPSIKRISLEQSNTTDGMLLELNSMPQLELLRVSSTRVSDVGLMVLDRLPNLSSLMAMDADIDGKGLENLSHVPRLQHLQVQTRKGDVVSLIGCLNDLRVLSLKAPLADSGMEHLAGLKKLQLLELVETLVRGPGIRQLAALPELNELVFQGGAICDEDVEAVAQVKSLKRLVLTRTRVTADGRNRLLSLSPGLSLTWSDHVPRD